MIKVVSWTISILVFLFAVLVLAVRTPQVQTRLTGLASGWLEAKTGAQLTIDRLHLTFRGNLQVDELLLATPHGDTLLYSHYLEVGASLPALMQGDLILTRIDWRGVLADVRADRSGVFNFQFLLDAFTSDEPPPPAASDKPLVIDLGTIGLADIRVRYHDAQNALEVRAQLHQVGLVTAPIDLDRLFFHLRSGSIDGAEVEVVQYGTTNSAAATDTSLLPEIMVDALALQNSFISYSSTPDSIQFSTSIGQIGLTHAHLDLNQSRIKADELSIATTRAAFTSDALAATSASSDPADAGVIWPQWRIDVGKFSMDQSAFLMETGPPADDAIYIDPHQMDWSFNAVKASDIHYAPGEVRITMDQLSIDEKKEGLAINGTFTAGLDGQSFQLRALELSTLHSSLHGDLSVQYHAIDSLVRHPLSSSIMLRLHALAIGKGDLVPLAPLLAGQPELQLLLEEPLKGAGTIHYRPEEVTADQLSLRWADQTRLAFSAVVSHPLDSQRISLSLPELRFSSGGRDMHRLKSALGLPVDLPHRIAIDGRVSADMSHVDGQLRLTSDEGQADLSIDIDDITGLPAYQMTTDFQRIDLNKWLQTHQLGKVSGKLTVAGKGTEPSHMTTEARLSLHSFEVLGQLLDSIEMTVALDSGSYAAQLSVDHPGIIADLTGHGRYTSANAWMTDVHIALAQFDLQTWGMAVDSILVSSELDLHLQRSEALNSLNVSVKDTRFRSDTDQHLLKPITLALHSGPDSLVFGLTSGLFSGRGKINASIDRLVTLSERWVPAAMVPPGINLDHLLEGIVASADLKFNPTSDGFEQIWPQVEVADTIDISLLIDQPSHHYDLTATAPLTRYKLQSLTDLYTHIYAQGDSIVYDIGFAALHSGPAQLSDLRAAGWYAHDQWQNRLSIEGSPGYPAIRVDTRSQWKADSLYTHIVPESLTLDSVSWTLPADNQIVYHDGQLYFYDFLLRHDDDLLEISSTRDAGRQVLDLRFENFQLRTLTAIINASAYPATGEINGLVSIRGLEDHPEIRSDIIIKDLTVYDQPIGLLQWQSTSDQANGSIIDISALSPDLDVRATGAIDQDGLLDLRLDLHKVGMSIIEGLSDGKLRQSEGHIAGSMRITAGDALRDYRGALRFVGVSFVVADINAPFSLEDESITVDNDLVRFESFSLRDEQNNLLELNGSINTADLTDPIFDFHITGENFQLLNSTAKDNELYYGKMAIDIDLAVTGRQSAPTVDVKARLNKGSHLTYILPESQLEIEEREGVVMFFNQQDSSTLQQTVRTPPQILDIQGVLLRSKLTIDPETRFKMIIDPRSGDYLEIGGEANLDIKIDRQGKTTMRGIYTARRGAYEVRLYEIVQRRFEVMPGSRIIWSGDPYNAELDLTAQYNLRTSVRELMEQQVANADPTTKISTRRDLPFEVLLRIQGSLEQPLMSFRLDMPEAVRNELGGNIYAKINQINENEDELNKQVFSLIAFNQFLPSVVTNAAGASTSNIAKSSVNQILSSQLNNLSQRYIKGIDIDFNLNSIADYQSGAPAERTELSVSIKKALFDDRVVISVGNSVDIEGQARQTNEWVDNVTIEYLLTEDGRYRVKGFQKNSFEDLVEGQVTITGLSLLFNKEFNRFRNIFNNTEEKP